MVSKVGPPQSMWNAQDVGRVRAPKKWVHVLFKGINVFIGIIVAVILVAGLGQAAVAEAQSGQNAWLFLKEWGPSGVVIVAACSLIWSIGRLTEKVDANANAIRDVKEDTATIREKVEENGRDIARLDGRLDRGGRSRRPA